MLPIMKLKELDMILYQQFWIEMLSTNGISQMIMTRSGTYIAFQNYFDVNNTSIMLILQLIIVSISNKFIEWLDD